MFHGLRACSALFARRPQDIVRVYVSAGLRREMAKLIEWCAKERRGFQVVADENLERLTGSIHHEGVAILAKDIRRWNLSDLLREIAAAQIGGPLLYLDGVHNPHNLGSILRTAAHFGVAAIVGKGGDLPPLSPAAVRVAEGAADVVAVCDVADPTADLRRLKEAGYSVVVTSSHRGDCVHDVPLDRKVVVVLGSEGKGVSPQVDASADRRLRIPGTGKVESLNVSVACGVLLGEIWRRSGPAGR